VLSEICVRRAFRVRGRRLNRLDEIRLWLPWLKRSTETRCRVFCFAHAGGGPSLFSRWPRFVSGNLELLPVQPPGHEARVREQPYRSIEELLPQLIGVIEPLLEVPFVLFGHSLGALIAFELAHQLQRQGGPIPKLLVVSSLRAPHLHARANRSAQPLYRLPDQQLIAEVDRRFGGIPSEIVTNEEFLSLLRPVLRADLQMAETYSFRATEPLRCPILALGGFDDPEVPLSALMAWETHTRGPFSWRLFPGGHFYVRDAPGEVIEAIESTLDQIVSK